MQNSTIGFGNNQGKEHILVFSLIVKKLHISLIFCPFLHVSHTPCQTTVVNISKVSQHGYKWRIRGLTHYLNQQYEEVTSLGGY